MLRCRRRLVLALMFSAVAVLFVDVAHCVGENVFGSSKQFIQRRGLTDVNQLPGVVVFSEPKTALISHEIANRVVADQKRRNEIQFPIRLRKVECDFAEAVKAVYEMSTLKFEVAFVLTDLCPDVNFRLSQITASDNNPAFADRTMYSNTFSILPSTETLSQATLRFLISNDWKKMLLIYDARTPASSYYSLISTSLVRYLEDNNVEVGRPIENKEFSETMSNVQQSGIKVVFLLMPAPEIASFLCKYLSESSQLAVSRFVFLLHTDVTDFPVELELRHRCPNVANLRLLTAFAIRYAPYDLMRNHSRLRLPHPNRIMCSARSFPRQSRLNSTLPIVSHYYRCYYYDSLRAIFRALRATLLRSSKPYVTHWPATLRNFRALNIAGKTGPIRFKSKTHERLGEIEVVQLANGRPRWIVIYNQARPKASPKYYRRVRWPRGRPPLDSVIRRRELLVVPFELLAAFSAAALLGIAVSLGILVTNIRFRSHSYIKMSSPNLNNLILIGSCLCYITVIMQGLGTNMLKSVQLFQAACTIEAWTLPIGFSLAFGAMLTKTWRVYAIFRHSTGMKRQVIPDSKLFIAISMFVLLDVLLNTLWLLFDPPKRETTVTQTTLADAYETTSFIEYCASRYSRWWTLAMWMPKGAVLIYGLYLAWKTRNVRLAALNDSYQVGVSIYIIVVLFTIGATAQPLFKTKVVISYCVLSSTLFLCTVIPEVVIFAPKLLKLWKDPVGDVRVLREEMKLAAKSTNRVATELARRYVTSEVKSRKVRLSELTDEETWIEKQLVNISNSSNPDMAISLAMMTLGNALLTSPTEAIRRGQIERKPTTVSCLEVKHPIEADRATESAPPFDDQRPDSSMTSVAVEIAQPVMAVSPCTEEESEEDSAMQFSHRKVIEIIELGEAERKLSIKETLPDDTSDNATNSGEAVVPSNSNESQQSSMISYTGVHTLTMSDIVKDPSDFDSISTLDPTESSGEFQQSLVVPNCTVSKAPSCSDITTSSSPPEQLQVPLLPSRSESSCVNIYCDSETFL